MRCGTLLGDLELEIRQADLSLEGREELDAEATKAIAALRRLERERLRPYASGRWRRRLLRRIRRLTWRFRRLAWLHPRAIGMRLACVWLYSRLHSSLIVRAGACLLIAAGIAAGLIYRPDVGTYLFNVFNHVRHHLHI
jgi:hypothetical protein